MIKNMLRCNESEEISNVNVTKADKWGFDLPLKVKKIYSDLPFPCIGKLMIKVH